METGATVSEGLRSIEIGVSMEAAAQIIKIAAGSEKYIEHCANFVYVGCSIQKLSPNIRGSGGLTPTVVIACIA